jgi:hypothetical protein
MNALNQTPEAPQVSEMLHLLSGATIDEDGRLNNYAIEPEMYIDQPGDLRQETKEARAKRLQELANLQEDEAEKLTMEQDLRHKGPDFF